jgi:hypothetical protein
VRGRLAGTQGRRCSGRVRVRIRRGGGAGLNSGRARLRSNCRYRRTVRLPSARVAGVERLRVGTRYLGNAFLRPDSARVVRPQIPG